MRRWVVTGPAGGGKSALSGFFADRGAALVNGDHLGHEVLARKEIIAAIGAEFGPDVVSSGTVDRAALGTLVFAEPAALVRLNRITHGPLATLAGERLDELEKEGGHRLAVFEAAVYFALPPVPKIEMVITVMASEPTRLTRMMKLKGLAPGEARARIAAQIPLQDGWDGADVVLENEGSLATLEAAAEMLWSRLQD
jgi:dephospho-CoA kinase